MKLEYATKYNTGQQVYRLNGLIIKTYTIVMASVDIISCQGRDLCACIKYRINEESDDDVIRPREVSEEELDENYFTSKQAIVDKIQSQL